MINIFPALLTASPYRLRLSQVQAATWALERGVCVVICNGMQEEAIKTILSGRKVGTFFTSGSASSASTDLLAEQGKLVGEESHH